MLDVISVDRDERRALLDRIERYYDAVPRSAARAEDFGPLTLFVRSGSGWPFYARPTPGRSAPVGAADVTRVRERQRELGMPESVEWVAESAPALRTATEQAGLVAHEHPLMVLDPEAPVPAAPAPPEGVDVRIVGPDDAGLPGALAVPYLAFTEPGADSAAEPARLVEVARYLVADGSVKQTAARVRAGLTCVAAAYGDGTALCAGQHQPVGAVTEIVGVGTLPAARRRGLARAVTAVLAADARARGVGTVFLTAGTEDVARLYAKLGFRRVATAMVAQPATRPTL